eukprot:1356050-Ditylum_brightwellii.AAC.1
MKIANIAIQLVATKRHLIVFEVEEGVVDKKLGEIRTYKLCMQPEEENSFVYLLTIEVQRGQNVGNMNAVYTL